MRRKSITPKKKATPAKKAATPRKQTLTSKYPTGPGGRIKNPNPNTVSDPRRKPGNPVRLPVTKPGVDTSIGRDKTTYPRKEMPKPLTPTARPAPKPLTPTAGPLRRPGTTRPAPKPTAGPFSTRGRRPAPKPSRKI